MTALVIALGFVTALLAVLVVGLLRSHADILRALHELGVGEEQLAARAAAVPRPAAGGSTERPDGIVERTGGRDAHDVAGELPDGGAAVVHLSSGRGTTLLAFLTTGCGTCQAFWDAFDTDEVHRLPGEDSRVVIVTRGADAESPGAVAALAPSRATTIMSSEAWDDYAIPVAPYFVLVEGSRGIVGEGAAPSWDQVLDLLGKAEADLDAAAAARAYSRRELLMGVDRADRADRQLADAGIHPGDASLYEPAPLVAEETEHR